MKIANPDKNDYHMHSLNWSDGMNTVDEIAQYAGKLGHTEIAITDHSQALQDAYGMGLKCFRSILKRWENVHNDVNVIFGVEADLLDEEGNICSKIEDKESDYLVLSAHPKVYKGSVEKITESFKKAIKKDKEGRIKQIGHPCSNKIAEGLDIKELAKAANDKGIGLEFNCFQHIKRYQVESQVEDMMQYADTVFVNSDAHTLASMRDFRKTGFDFLRKKGYLE